MTQELAFPKLGIFLNLNRVAFAIGPIKVYWYGIIVVTGIALGFLYAYKRREEFDVTADMISDTALYGVIAGIIGARIYYVAFSWDFYKNHPQDIIKIWEGGIAIYGGIIGAVIMILILARHWKINPLNITDCCAAGLILGQAIGRWGNFMNIEAFGGNTTLPWGMTSPVISEYLLSNMEELAKNGIIADPMGMVHPTFLYESIWNLLGFLFIAAYTRRRTMKGEITLLYLGVYGLGRAWIEGLRTDSLMLGSFRVSQMLAILMVLISVGLLCFLKNRQKNGKLPKWLELTPKAAQKSEEPTENPKEGKA